MDDKLNNSVYLSKRGYVIRKSEFSDEQLLSIKLELRGRPLSDSKYTSANASNIDTTYPVYLDTKTKLYIPKIYGIKKFGFPETVSEYFEGKEWERPIEFKGSLYDYQIEPVDKLIKSCHENHGGILTLPTGFGKCHGINTPIIMYDGTIKMVQDIQVGDLLMGDDSTPRKILSLARGTDDMYDIIPLRGDKYTVNKEHILVLKNTRKEAWVINKSETDYDVRWWENNYENSKMFSNKIDAYLFLDKLKDKHQKYIEINVKNYIKHSKNFKHYFKGYRVSVDFSCKELDEDPYMVGRWLCSRNKTDNLISKKYNLLYDKHILHIPYIPHIFKCNSRDNRLKLLAGLLDAGSCYYKGVYEILQPLEHEQLINDIMYLCYSLGFACYKTKKKTSWIYNGVHTFVESWKIIISGPKLYEIPILCIEKKAKHKKLIKDVSVTDIKVKYIGKDNYYGFTIDGNHRYLLSDFTVTHNTISLLYVLSKLKGKAIIIVNKIPLMNQWISEINKFLPDAKVGTIQGQKNIDVQDCDIIVAMLQSMARIDYPDELFRDIRIAVVDETHNVASKVFSKILFKLCCKYTIGLSATPNRSDGCEYIFKWHLGDIVYETKSERKGKPPIIRYLKIDSTDYKEICTVNKFTGQKQIQFTSMLSDLVNMTKRNGLIIDLIKDLIKKENGRKILVLSDRRNHLQTLNTLLDDDLKVTFTYGLFLGGMKQKDLDKGRSCQVILATYQAFGEGVSERDLDTLLLITPKKFIGHLKNTTKNESGKLEQIVGRIFRKDHVDRHPLIIDFYDNFSVYKSQAAQRKSFYKQHFNNSINEEWSINFEDINKGNNLVENTSYIPFIKIKNKKNTIKNDDTDNTLSKSIVQYCILDD